MYKETFSWKGFKSLLRQDYYELIIASIFLTAMVYFFFNSKLVLSVVALISFLIINITYRINFKKIKNNEKNQQYYQFLGKMLYIIILGGFFLRYVVGFYRLIRNSRNTVVVLLYPRLMLLVGIIGTLFWLFLLLQQKKFKRNIIFVAVGLITLYETLVLFVVRLSLSDYIIADYLMSLIFVVLCLGLIYFDANTAK